MRKLMFSVCAIVIAAASTFVWSHIAIEPTQASASVSINPTDMMMTYKAQLPVEQWDAI